MKKSQNDSPPSSRFHLNILNDRMLECIDKIQELDNKKNDLIKELHSIRTQRYEIMSNQTKIDFNETTA